MKRENQVFNLRWQPCSARSANKAEESRCGQPCIVTDDDDDDNWRCTAYKLLCSVLLVMYRYKHCFGWDNKAEGGGKGYLPSPYLRHDEEGFNWFYCTASIHYSTYVDLYAF